MVNFLSRRKPAFFFAFLTEWMFSYVSVPDASPIPSVMFFCFWVTVVAFVSADFILGVLLTEPAVC
jgi:hypothetical protein